MYVRLAFSIAAHLDPEILVVDEVLAVGDYSFQQKCLSRMNEVSQNGATVLFVSHSLETIQSLCDRAILLNNGKLVAHGDVNEVVNKYKAQKFVTAVKSIDHELIKLNDIRITSDTCDSNNYVFDATESINLSFIVQIDKKIKNTSRLVFKFGR